MALVVMVVMSGGGTGVGSGGTRDGNRDGIVSGRSRVPSFAEDQSC